MAELPENTSNMSEVSNTSNGTSNSSSNGSSNDSDNNSFNVTVSSDASNNVVTVNESRILLQRGNSYRFTPRGNRIIDSILSMYPSMVNLTVKAVTRNGGSDDINFSYKISRQECGRLQSFKDARRTARNEAILRDRLDRSRRRRLAAARESATNIELLSAIESERIQERTQRVNDLRSALQSTSVVEASRSEQEARANLSTARGNLSARTRTIPQPEPEAVQNADGQREDEEEGPICTICYDEIVGEDIVLQPCGHRFHFHCIMHWRESGQTNNLRCPVCRGAYTNEL